MIVNKEKDLIDFMSDNLTSSSNVTVIMGDYQYLLAKDKKVFV